jgi:hypothetical protein
MFPAYAWIAPTSDPAFRGIRTGIHAGTWATSPAGDFEVAGTEVYT